MEKKITSFTNLNAWKESHRLVLMIYEVVEKFPVSEKYILSTQILRAAISVSSNIAEGFTRKTAKDKQQFYYISKASLTEIQNHILIARDRKYLPLVQFEKIANQTVVVDKLIAGIIKSAQTKN